MANINPSTIIIGQSEKLVKPILAIVAMVLLYVGIKKLIVKIKTRNVGKASYNAANINPSVNYDNYANAVHAEFTKNWFFISGSKVAEISKNLMALNDDEIKFVYNQYDKLFGKDGETMYQVMNSVTMFLAPDYDAIMLRMQRLSLM